MWLFLRLFRRRSGCFVHCVHCGSDNMPRIFRTRRARGGRHCAHASSFADRRRRVPYPLRRLQSFRNICKPCNVYARQYNDAGARVATVQRPARRAVRRHIFGRVSSALRPCGNGGDSGGVCCRGRRFRTHNSRVFAFGRRRSGNNVYFLRARRCWVLHNDERKSFAHF